MKIYLDGLPLVNPTSSLLKPTFILRKLTDTGDRAFSFTGELEFTGADYTYLYARLVSHPQALENKVVLKFVNDCCSQNQTYEFWIDHQSLQWCEHDCTLKAAATEKSLSNDQYTCLQNTVIWDNFDGFTNQMHPRMSYCNELRPNWLGHLAIILLLATYTAFLTIGPILLVIALIITIINAVIVVINAIIDGINTLLPSGSEIGNMNPIDLDNDPGTNAFAEMGNFIDNLMALGVGCGRKHPSPLVRGYAENVCKKCGITFVSSILNNPNIEYWNLVYVNAPVHKGTEEADNSTYWIDENSPILSGLQYFDQLKPVFNANFDIVNSQLIFERRDFFVPKNPWLDLTTYNPIKINKVCWSWSRKDRFSYADLYYQKDGVNWVGSEAVARWGDIVDWNTNPYSSLQKGEYKPLINFAACRFRDDGIDQDVLTFYEDQPTLNTLITRYKNSMIMNSHTCYLPMLVIWDGQSVSNAFADKFININYPALAGVVGLNQYYNFPMWFKDGYPGNLYDRYHYIENPRISGYQGFDFECEVDYDCTLLSLVDIDGVVKTSRGDSKGSLTVTINTSNNTLTIKGSV